MSSMFKAVEVHQQGRLRPMPMPSAESMLTMCQGLMNLPVVDDLPYIYP